MESWMTVYNWPVFRCPQLAGFEVSPEDLDFNELQAACGGLLNAVEPEGSEQLQNHLQSLLIT